MLIDARRTRLLLLGILAFHLLTLVASVFFLLTDPPWFEAHRTRTFNLVDLFFYIVAIIVIPIAARGIVTARHVFDRVFWIAFAAQITLALVSPIHRLYLSAIGENTLGLVESLAFSTVFGILVWNHLRAPFEIHVPTRQAA